ncbi:MAG TPA: hypothetical protein VN442_15985 [Bryobacteraceae bacterium]|nr:hypothetical protein [Bryobacteraceae bacterium]
MTNEKLSVQLSLDELQAILELVDNQLFRMKFIDPKMPGHKANPDKLQLAKAAVQVLLEAFKKAKGFNPNEHNQLLKRSAG